MTSVSEVMRVLDTIIDPCSIAASAPAGLSTLGIIQNVEVMGESRSGFSVVVQMGLTSPGCLMGAMFIADAERLISALPGVKNVQVILKNEFVWQPHHMDPAYRAHLSNRRRSLSG